MKISSVLAPNASVAQKCCRQRPIASSLSKVGPTDQFDWFMDKIVGLFTSSLDSYSEKLRSLNTSSLWASWLLIALRQI